MGIGIIFLTDVTELAQLRWIGHVVRKRDERCPKMGWQARIQVKRPNGRPRHTWEGIKRM
jgi:hypothetical protein